MYPGGLRIPAIWMASDRGMGFKTASGTNVAVITDAFRVGPDSGTNLAVYTELTNHTAQIAGKLDTTGDGGSLTGLTVGQVAGAVNSNGGAATNLTLSGATTLTNGTTYSAGAYYGTNGVFWTRDGTNYWILFQ